jgi:hypothetical protein
MEKSKKNGVGLAVAWRLLGGVNNWGGKDLNARIAVFCLLAMMLSER